MYSNNDTRHLTTHPVAVFTPAPQAIFTTTSVTHRRPRIYRTYRSASFTTPYAFRKLEANPELWKLTQ
jgi:hypothetical protein